MPTRDTLDIQFHANQTVTIDGTNLAPQDAFPILRPATQADIPFLLDLRHQTMDATMIAAGKTPSDDAHLQRVLHAFESAHIVLMAEQPVGLLKVVRTAPVWDLIQIQVAPAAQGKGLGARLLRALVAEAMQSGAAVKLSVFKVNPARRLYERLGFTVTEETEDAYEMVFNNPCRVTTR